MFSLDEDDRDALPKSCEELSVLSEIPRNIRVNLAEFFEAAPEEVVGGSEVFDDFSALTAEDNDFADDEDEAGTIRSPAAKKQRVGTPPTANAARRRMAMEVVGCQSTL